MTVRTTQFSYDDLWLKRKNKINATWKDVMEAGIIAIEIAQGIENKVKPAPEPMPEVKDPEAKEAEELVVPVVEEPDVNYWFNLETPTHIGLREFDAYFPDEKVWKTLEFDEIPINMTFRVRDDDRVLVLNDYNKFEKLSTIQLRNGNRVVMVKAIKANRKSAVKK